MAVYKNALKVKPLVAFNGDLVKPDVQSLVKKEKMCHLARGSVISMIQMVLSRL